jgi:hypothetical protein
MCFECSGIVTLLCQDCAQQIFQLGKLVLPVEFQTLEGALLRGLEMLEIKVSDCIEQPISREVDRIEFEHCIGGVNGTQPHGHAVETPD